MKSIWLSFFMVSAVLLLVIVPAFAAKPTWARKATVFPSQCNLDFKGPYRNKTPRGALVSPAAPCLTFRILSPDGNSLVTVKYRKTQWDYMSAYIEVTTPDKGTRSTELPYGFQDIDLLWSSDSKAFFVNGGNGGGYWGFWVYVYLLSDSKLEPIDITANVITDMVKSFPPCKAAYLDKEICTRWESNPDREDYNLTGIDWVRGSSALVVMAEVPCAGSVGGIMCQVMGYELEVPTGKILKRMTAREFAARWQESMAWKFEIPDPPDYCDQPSDRTRPGCAGHDW